MEGAITPLWIMAVVSVLEALVLIGVAVGGFIVYRRTMQTIADLEARQIEPLREKVEGILGDVHAITARVSHETKRVDNAIHTTIDRVDETAERVKGTVRDRVAYAAGVVRGVRAVIMSLFNSEAGREPRTTTAAGQV
jgi:hypothetical protein